MRILVFHGYLLRGTGSNVYNAELAQALSESGHEVHLFSQDLQASSLPWIDRLGTWPDGELRLEETGGSSPGPGSISVYLPPIGRTLPVFVVDDYEGFEARAYPDLEPAEVESYIEANVAAIDQVIARVGQMDAAVANHLIAGPAICARAGLEFAVKVHGSDLSYAVIPHSERFVPLAREGLDPANAVVVGSAFTAEALWGVMGMPGLEAKTRLGPPGVDTKRFHPASGDRDASVHSLIDDLERRASGGEGNRDLSAFGREPAEAVSALSSLVSTDSRRAVFVGKLLVNKGVDLLLAAWPLVVRRVLDSGQSTPRLLLIGFGAFEAGLRSLWSALSSGDLDSAIELAREGRRLEGAGETGSLAFLDSFLSTAPEGYAEMGRAAAGTVDWTGRLEHGEVAQVLPATDALVMPSTFPEAFGMVAAEAAACGVPFVSAAHSGMLEVAQRLGGFLDPDDAEFLSFEVGSDSVCEIAEATSHWLELDARKREEMGALLASAAKDSYSWESLASAMVAVASGDLDKLPEPAS